MKYLQLLPTWNTEPQHFEEKSREYDGGRSWLGNIWRAFSTSQKVFWTLILVGALFNIGVILDYRIIWLDRKFVNCTFERILANVFFTQAFTQTTTPPRNRPIPLRSGPIPFRSHGKPTVQGLRKHYHPWCAIEIQSTSRSINGIYPIYDALSREID